MKSLQENEGYDVPWEFVRRRTAVSPTGTKGSSRRPAGTAGGPVTSENGIRRTSGADAVAGSERMSRTSKAGDEPTDNGCKDRTVRKKSPPPVLPKPTLTLNCNGIAEGNGRFPVSSSARVSVGDANGPTNTPPCGVRAQLIRQERNGTGPVTPVGTVSKHPSASDTAESPSGVVVWEYRKPENDPRPSSEYDVPWDSRTHNTPCLCPNADEAVYDEPWDAGRIKETVQRLALASMKRRSTGGGDANQCPPSQAPSDNRSSAALPSSSRTPDAPPVSQRKSEQYPELVPVSGNGGGKKAGNNTKAAVRVETAFCGKPTKFGQKNHQDKDKLIQQLCSGDSLTKEIEWNGGKTREKETGRMEELEMEKEQKVDIKYRNGNGSPGDTMENGTSQDGAEVNDEREVQLPDYDTPWEFTSSPETSTVVKRLQNLRNNRHTVRQPVQQQHTGAETKSESKSKLCRQHLSLNLGCMALNQSAKIDTSLSLNEQMWYHGNITRAEAEQRLSKVTEGAFLVRVCESSTRQGEEYALSLKSAKGFMHMKIQQDSQRKWILGYFSQPFESVPVMIRYYSVNKLPIKGAEHMRLVRPVADQVL